MLKFLYLLAKDFVYLFLRLILWCFVIFGLAMITKFFWSQGFSMYFDTVDVYKLNVIKYSALGVCGVMCVFIMLMSIIKPAQWFAENMFTNQGALTHTLPVKPGVHIATKSISALLMNIIMLFAIVVSFFAFKEGIDYFDDIFMAIDDVINAENADISLVPTIMWSMAAIISLCFVITASCYLSMSMGQLVSNFRNLFIFISYVGIFILSMVVFVFCAMNGNIIDISVIDGMQGLLGFVNNIFITVFKINIVLGIVYNALSGVIVSYKLNI